MRQFSKLFIPLLIPLSLNAVPQGLQVKHGDVKGPRLQENEWVIQSGEKAVVHWDSFSVDSGETLRFIQQSGTSAILNRIVGPNCSEILGTLVSNGSVYIINPNGVLIGPNGRIEAAGFIASSLDILDIDFLEQKSILFSGSGLGKVVNLGSIESEQGSIFLIGNLVKNEGTIRADQGTIGLGVGNEILLQLEHVPRMLIRTIISGEKEEGVSLEQSGRLEALKIELKSGSSLYSKAIQCSGIIEATSVRETGGMIEIFAPNNECAISGSLHTSGGKIHVLGEEIQLIDHAVLDASGKTGGEILIGGDYQGKNPNIFHAKRSFVGKDVILQADALENGNGGKIIVWGDEATVYFGKSSVRGGDDGGDGGLVEVSGKYLDYQGLADRRAPNGKAGLLLLDPININITNNASVDSVNVINPGGGGTYTFNACAPSPALIDNTLLSNNLNLGNVTINTSATGAAGCLDVGTITVSSPVSWTEATTLALVADANIVINAPIANTNSTPGFMAMAFTAKGTTGTGNHGVYLFAEISSDAGSISLVGNSSPTGANINGILIEGIPMFVRGKVKTTSGDIFIAGNVPNGPTAFSSGILFNLNGAVESSTGNIKLSGVSAVSHGLNITASNIQTLTTGTVTLGDPITDPNTSQVIEGCIGGSAIQSHGIRLGGPFDQGVLNAFGDFIAINKIISGTGAGSAGVVLNGPSSQIISTQGNIQITASSRGTGGGFGNFGIFMSNTVSSIRALVGSITLIGIGSNAALPLNTQGFAIFGTGNTNKIFAGGDLRIAGINPQVAATTGAAAVSIFLGPFPSSITSGSGNIIISGVNNSTSANAHGVNFNNSNWTPLNLGTIRFGDTITDPNGVTVTGCQGGSGSGSHGVNLNTSNWTLTQPLSFTNCVGGGSVGGSGYGINVPATSSITTSSSITVGPGQCLSGTGANSIGASFAGNVTSTGGGSIIINATSQGSSGVCPGIQLSAATISATGSGAITLNGTGSSSGGAGSYGVVITGANARVTSVDGDITFGSTGSGTTGQAYLGGTGITNVSTTGTGSILFSGAFLDSNFVPIVSSTNNVSFSQAVILNALTSTIDLTGGSGNLTFSSAISGTSASVHDLNLLAGPGSITALGAIDLSGQASTLNGGTFLASAGSSITLSDISTVGNPTLNAAGPNGGPVSVTSTSGGISVGNINTSGATGSVTGGNAGDISLQATQTYTSGSLGNIPNGILVLKGNLTASGGGPAGTSGAISLSTAARGALMSIATITSSFAGNDVTLTGASVTTGPQEAMTIFGNLTMNVTGSITVTDLIALNAISLTATNLTQQAAPAGSFLDPFGNLNASSQSHIVSPVSITRNISGIETINGIILLLPGLSRFALVYAPNSYILNSTLVVLPPVPLPFSIAEQIIQLVIANTQMELLLPDPWHRTFLPPWERKRLFAEMPPEELFPISKFIEVDRNI